jgi:hypothetical protein
MEIKKFVDFIKENLSDTPEEYIKMELIKLKRKIDAFFDKKEGEEDEREISTMTNALKKGKEREESEKKISFSELGLVLQSSEISKYSSLYDNIIIKFSDEEYLYNLYVTIPLEEAVPEEGEDSKSIKKCYIKFKKYDLVNFDLIGQITRNTDIDKVDEDYLVSLKIDLDDEFDKKEEVGIETE